RHTRAARVRAMKPADPRNKIWSKRTRAMVRINRIAASYCPYVHFEEPYSRTDLSMLSMASDEKLPHTSSAKQINDRSTIPRTCVCTRVGCSRFKQFGRNTCRL